MLIGRPKNASALLITTFEGFGDLVYHTPTIRVFSHFYKHLDVWCRQKEPFLNNPYIRTLTVFDKTLPRCSLLYDVFKVTGDSLAQFPHSSIHTVDLVSIKALQRVLRASEKTLEAYWTQEDVRFVQQLLTLHPLAEKNKIREGKFVVISPSKTWESRTLPLPFYQQLISGIQARGYGVVLVGKEIAYASAIDTDLRTVSAAQARTCSGKTLYPEDYFPGCLCLYNQLTFAQLCALYSLTAIAINTENGNHPISCTNDHCWNVYIPSLTAPEYRLPHRHGSQYYRTAVAANAQDYYPASVYGETGCSFYSKMPVQLPTPERVLQLFDQVIEAIKEGKNFI